MGTNGMSARVFKRKTTKINMAARLLSRFAFPLPLSLLSRTTVHQKTARHVLKNTLLSTPPDVAKLRSQFAVLITPTSEREDRDRKRRKSQSGHGAKREHAQYRNLKNFYFDDVTKKRGFLSDLKRILCAFQTVKFFENWHMDRIFLFLAASKKSSNFIHTFM